MLKFTVLGALLFAMAGCATRTAVIVPVGHGHAHGYANTHAHQHCHAKRCHRRQHGAHHH